MATTPTKRPEDYITEGKGTHSPALSLAPVLALQLNESRATLQCSGDHVQTNRRWCQGSEAEEVQA